MAEYISGEKRLTWARIAAFSGGQFSPAWPKTDMHTSLDFARSVGLPHCYVSGTQYLGYVCELMLDLFGDDWLAGGCLRDIKLVKPVQHGDVLQVVARRDDADVLGFEILNENGQVVALGFAGMGED